MYIVQNEFWIIIATLKLLDFTEALSPNPVKVVQIFKRWMSHADSVHELKCILKYLC